MVIPITWALVRNWSLGGLPEIISYNKNITWPPSSAGIGKIFINANIIESNAVMPQNLCQFQVVSNKPPIEANPPICFAPSLLKISDKDLTYVESVSIPLVTPAGIASGIS